MIGTELTIGRWLADRARLTPDRVAIRFLGAELTYADLDRSATRLAAGLAERGLRRGDRLSTLTQTSPDHVATLFACARLGVALQPISWRLAPAEIAYQLEDAEPALLLASDDHAELAREAGGDVEIARIGDTTLETDGEVGDVARDDIVSSNSFALRGERPTSRRGPQVARSARSPHLVFIRCRRDSAWMLQLPAIKRESKSRA